MRNIGISIANACVVSSLLVMGSASAGNYAYECVDNYEACFPGQSLSNRCTNARGFATVLHNDGNNQLPSFENALVWNTDSIESDKFSYGQDTIWTDRPDSDLWFFSGHGICTNALNGYCDAQSGCPNPQARCDYLAHKCSTYADGFIVTCSSVDKNPDSIYGAHTTNQSTQMNFGESPATGGWGGVGTNGNANVVVFDTSCPMALNWLIERNANIFSGMHVELGFSGEGGDTGDIGERGTYFATRLVNGEAVGPAWLDTSRYDAGYGLNGPVCAVAMTCDIDQGTASYRVNNERWPFGIDPFHPPTWCQWIYWCNF